MTFRHLGPYFLIAQMTTLLAMAMTPRPVKSQPLPIAEINAERSISLLKSRAGYDYLRSAVTAPMHEKMFLTKLLTATPEDAFLGMNSVNMVVAIWRSRQ